MEHIVYEELRCCLKKSLLDHVDVPGLTKSLKPKIKEIFVRLGIKTIEDYRKKVYDIDNDLRGFYLRSTPRDFLERQDYYLEENAFCPSEEIMRAVLREVYDQ